MARTYLLSLAIVLLLAALACTETTESVHLADGDAELDSPASDGDAIAENERDAEHDPKPDGDRDETVADGDTVGDTDSVADGDSDDTPGPDGDREWERADSDSDADPEQAEADTDPATACEELHGSCAAGICPGGTTAAAQTLGCTVMCCLDEAQLPCVQNGGNCVTGDWQRVLDYPCAASHVPATESGGCEQVYTWCCAPATRDCVGEGEMGDSADDDPDNDTCCTGLSRIARRYPGNTGGCEEPSETQFLCTACGNGVCDLYENTCNCTDDCAVAGSCDPQNSGSDCPAGTCRNRDSAFPWVGNECVQYDYQCNPENNYCMREEASLPGYICNMKSGRCEPM